MPARHDEPRRTTIVLTGFMGTGKSTVGRRLAERLGHEFVDTDELIEARHGPILQIFAEHGEARFREIEREVAGELAGRDGLVVSTGGRLLLDQANADALGAGALVVCLVASVDELARRLADEAEDRPLLAGGDPRARIEELLAERRAGYARFAQVDTDGRTPDEVADAVLALLDER
ncbi:MAG TPA: shikimate kinase [Acidimicrobiales bacterium]|nr:shikimate kinase [Acidimicrobiales bacterium]